jgi:phenylacetate-CoA ligase
MSADEPQVRFRIDASIEPRWGWTLGELARQYLLRDGATGWYAWITDAEASVAMALRYIDSPTIDRVRRYVKAKDGLDLDPAEISTIIERFARLGLLDEGQSPDEIRSRQRRSRRTAYIGTQVAALRSMVEYLAEESPHYSSSIRQHCGGEVPDIRSLDDIRLLPRLSKATFRTEMVKIHTTALTQNRDAYPTSWATSSGTSGNRVQTLTDPNRQKRFVSDCTWQFMADTIPTAKMTKSCVLTTPVCSGTECHMDINRPLEERLISDGRRLILNSFASPAVVPDTTLQKIGAELETFRPNVLRGAASYLAAYARYSMRTGATPPPLDAVVLGWELNSRLHVKLLEDVFQCPVIDEWGATEMMPIATRCPDGNYHVADEHYIEVVRNGEPVAPGEIGQILVTSLRRHATPLLRYEIGDLARAGDPDGCPCGEPTQIFATIEGRARDVVVSATGYPVTARGVDDVVAGLDEPRRGIRYYSLVQTGPEEFRFLYVPDGEAKPAEEKLLYDDLVELLTTESVSIERTREIFPSNSGKFRLAYQDPQVREVTW